MFSFAVLTDTDIKQSSVTSAANGRLLTLGQQLSLELASKDILSLECSFNNSGIKTLLVSSCSSCS